MAPANETAIIFNGVRFEPTNDFPLSKLARLLEKIDITNDGGCWEWQAYRTPQGYGRVSHGEGSGRAAHRIVWAALRGEIQDGMHLHHKCGNRACCNPDHLEPTDPIEHGRITANGTAAENREKEFCKRGHPLSGDNLYEQIDRTGARHRRCRQCRNDWQNAKNARNRQPKEKATHCKRGHEYTPENTYLYNGIRCCRSCHAINSAKWHQKQREKRPPKKREKPTHCVHGHEYTPENTGITYRKEGGKFRYCKTCRREYNRRKYEKRKGMDRSEEQRMNAESAEQRKAG